MLRNDVLCLLIDSFCMSLLLYCTERVVWNIV